MKDKKNKRLVPELRFSEFEEDGEWEVEDLGKIAKRVLKKNKTGLVKSVFTNSATDGIIDQREYFEKDIANKSNLENYYIVEEGDYVYNPRISTNAPVGPISKNRTNSVGVMSPLYTVFRFNSKENDFYEYYFQSLHWYSSIRKASNTGARFDRMSIKTSDFMKIPVLFPSPHEQQKIAATLTTLDELIAAEQEKWDTLAAHKKGLLQQLFPAKGEKVPKLRFRKFEGEWEEKRIENVCEKPFSGGTPRSTNDTYYGGDIPFIRSAEINEDNTELFLTQSGYDYSSAKMVKKGDVLIALYGANSGDVAISKINGAINQAILCLRSKTSNEFLHQYLTFKKDWIISTYLQGGQGNLSGMIIKSVELYFPKDPQEQQKIARCLSSLDEWIAAQSEKIDALKDHKKGLMQGLFT